MNLGLRGERKRGGESWQPDYSGCIYLGLREKKKKEKERNRLLHNLAFPGENSSIAREPGSRHQSL